ncbi:Receptor homology region, transmembrane domain-and RING domain-containing protein 3 [Pleurostoma richardsiae]|uniref:Receptor homology region, transmembrane domain-and RING domain-containing protein 3 n=1 Tax=Pleurostoma richardsiae TaxID=41990 RepID=A0AA38RWJ8_9PEZI|nr:Receptor homology region, transmembrane domain-and RING domain-containing protein 3 [Pleurostoma richardsiae]
MAIINPAFVEASQHFARAVEHQARQVASSTVSSAISSATAAVATSPVPSSTVPSSATPADTAINSGTSSAGGNGGQNNQGGGSSSPLLFFVALGFGVVFTNLWIIVGVKYCFRYNARNRQLRMTGEDGEPINLENVPRPHRRRREKKLMTMDEVNEKFPMLKYKTWVASRAREGLPTRGGVSRPASRAASLRDVDGVVPDLPAKERDSTEERPPTSATSNINQEKEDPKTQATESTSAVVAETPKPLTEASSAPAVAGTEPLSRAASIDSRDHDHDHDHDHSDDDDDEHIDAALPPECYGTSGDTCAICIDTLEDDDDVRGLTCGHAFHAVCLDPWLTSRRACCPLCKADYYTPKPRPGATEGAEGTAGVITVTITGDPRTNRMNMPSRPTPSWMSIGGRSRTLRPVRFMGGGSAGNAATPQQQQQQQGADDSGGRQFGFFRRSQRSDAAEPQNTQPESGSFFSGLRHQLPGFRRAQNGEQAPAASGSAPTASGTNQEVSPSQLEAGTAPALESR